MEKRNEINNLLQKMKAIETSKLNESDDSRKLNSKRINLNLTYLSDKRAKTPQPVLQQESLI
jgi:hypothetical protein